MKTLAAALLLLAFTICAKAQSPMAYGQFITTNTSTTVPVQLVTTNLYVKSVTLIGKSFYQTTNTTAVHIGFGNSTNTRQGITIDPGSYATITAPFQSIHNLSNIWLDVSTANDGVIVIYER